ncbi:MAG: phosphate acyltransferase PlsX [Clostridiales bacterium]|nr:phosphate acyltransferase PlsX [Candidatus Equinaster intestinalis]
MKIAVDAFGGDNAPLEIIKGAALAQAETGVDILLTGDENVINNCIKENNIVFKNLEIIHTTDVISMHDDPTSLLKAHRSCSMAAAFDAVAEGKADAFVSAGSTGAIVVGGTLIVKRIKGVKRPALGSMLPSPSGSYMLMDMGANAECRPEMLCQFAVMASCYLENVEGRKNPKIGLLNIGTEETKGDETHKEAYKLLQKAPINFIGNVESREMPNGVCDAVIADGFTGNIALKLLEGTVSTMFKMLKGVFYKNIISKLAALVLKKGLYGLKNTMDASEIGGALLMGVSKPVIKAHGSSDAKAVKGAIKQAIKFAENGVVDIIAENLKEA